MAYRRSTKRYPARRRPTRKRSYPSRRRFTGKRRSTARPMSRKRILNISSRKKSDTMQNYTNVNPGTEGGTTYTADNSILSGGNLYGFLWCATARNNNDGTGAGGIIMDSATRTAMTCYMRGLKEKIQIQTNSGMSWQWRRICFTMKGGSLDNNQDSINKLYAFTTSGFKRVTANWYGMDKQKQALFAPLFKGGEGIDWKNYFSAKTDANLVSVKYDKTVIIQSGNQSGVMRNFNRWHPMNKNLVYNDDESGGAESTGNLSTNGRAGMGDYYVVDLIGSGTGGTSSDRLSWAPTATLYWHEK